MDPKIHAASHHAHIESIFQGQVALDLDPLYHEGLHPNTKVHIYNISTHPYTVLHFSCPDRLGLLCEILEFLAPYNIQVHRAYVNAQEFIAANLFFISNVNGKPLSPLEIEFLQNLFEYDLKIKIDHHNNTY
jgi:UTP:GlnB (protein PII) uridylyltransferase